MNRYYVIILFSICSLHIGGLAQSQFEIKPVTMLINMPAGYLEVQEIELINGGGGQVKVEAKFDTSWIDLTPIRFDMDSGIKKKMLVFIFIPENEDPVRNGEIAFYRQGTDELYGKLDIYINPTLEQENAVIKPEYVSHSRELVAQKPVPNMVQNDDAVAELEYRIEELEQEVDASHYLISNLKDELNRKEVEMVKLLESMRSGNSEVQTTVFPGTNSSESSEALRVLYQLLVNALEPEIEYGEAVLKMQNGKIYFSIPGQIAFASGSNYLRLKGEKILDLFSNVLAQYENRNFQLMVIGHTDSVQYQGGSDLDTFGNWELSAMRAAKVVKMLQNKTDYSGKQLIAACNASYSPVADNKTRKGRDENRRIEVLVSDIEQ